MEADKMQTDSLSRQLVKMPYKNLPKTCSDTVSSLFDVAASKMTDEKDKKILENLRAHIA